MRKVMLILGVFLLSITSVLAFQCGDCDTDGFVTILDAHLASKHSTGLAQISGDAFSACNVAGVLGNEFIAGAEISILDALTIAQYSVGKVSQLQCAPTRPILFSRNLEIYLMNSDGSNQRAFSFNNSAASWERDPVWSPDNQWIAFASFRNGRQSIYRIPSNATLTTEPEQITFGPGGSDNSPRWSQDGSEIVYVSSKTGSRELYILNTTSLATFQVTNTPNASIQESRPSWSPNGAQLAYQVGTNIFKINRDGSGTQQITSGNMDNNPYWGPNGRIAISRTLPGLTANIWTIDEFGNNPLQITNTTHHDLGSWWVADGSKILFYAQPAGTQREIFSTTVASFPQSVVTRLTTNMVTDQEPSQ